MVPAPESVAAAATPLAVVPVNSGGSDEAPRRRVRALAPGFRFHPTDEELVIYYLKRKICRKSFLYDAITSVDIYKSEPWHLPDKSQIKSRDQEWYFFSALDRKYTNGARMNRATLEGYWKATGNDRAVKHNGEVVGLKKTLVFHQGRAPDGKRTNWVMHEYRLVEAELQKCGPGRDPYVLCRVFHKSNMGPPIGHRYAPFVEQEWDDVSGMVPGEELAEESEGTGTIKALPSTEEDLNSPPLPIKTQCLLDVCKNERVESDNCAATNPNPVDAPPLLRYKRRKSSIDLNLKASDGTETLNKQPPPHQGPCSSPTTSGATNDSNPTSRLSALVEYSLMESLSLKETTPNPRPGFDSSILNSSVPPEYINFINSLQEEVYKVSMDWETLRLEMFSVRAMMSILQTRLDNVMKENKDLKKRVEGA